MGSRSPSPIDVAILAGGLGTRLREAVPNRPKTLAEVGGKPFLFHLLDRISSFGFRRVVLCTGHRGEQVEEAVGSGYPGLAILFSRETSPLGTGGALRLADPMLSSDPVLAMNGDSFCEADLGDFVEAHNASGVSASMLTVRVDDVSGFGTVRLGEHGEVTGFGEKGLRGGGWINAGVYLLGRSVLRGIPPDRFVSLEREVFPGLVGKGLRGHRSRGRFIDIGTAGSYASSGRFMEEWYRGDGG